MASGGAFEIEDDHRITDVRILRPQEIPTYVAEGMFDLGITARQVGTSMTK